MFARAAVRASVRRRGGASRFRERRHAIGPWEMTRSRTP